MKRKKGEIHKRPPLLSANIPNSYLVTRTSTDPSENLWTKDPNKGLSCEVSPATLSEAKLPETPTRPERPPLDNVMTGRHTVLGARC